MRAAIRKLDIVEATLMSPPLPIRAEFLPRVKRDEPMSRHTSWHIGGPADVFFTPADRTDLIAFLEELPKGTPLFWLGLGSNLLVRDGGIRGVVIDTTGLDKLEQIGPTTLYVDAGVPCARIARRGISLELGPAEFFAGIPGALGGALVMNAGAFGGETWPRVRAVDVCDARGRERRRDAREYSWSYRRLIPPVPGEYFLGAVLEFERRPGLTEDGMRELIARRKETQPIGEWSCGSTFTNPKGLHAARLIEAAGLKGHRIGDIMVSTKHANFLVNVGEAKAADVEKLVKHIQAEVQTRAGVRLTPEFHAVGEAS